MKQIPFIVFTFSMLLANQFAGAHADISTDNTANNTTNKLGSCHKFTFETTPDRTDSQSTHTEVWCYRLLQQPHDAWYIFNIDDNEVRPELAAIVETDNSNPQIPVRSILHGSLLVGKVSVHRLVHTSSHFNPLPVPLTPPKNDVNAVTLSETELGYRVASISASADETLQTLLSASIAPEVISISEGAFSGSSRSDSLPWRGYWWPYSRGALHSQGRSSPLGKYDSYVEARTGSNPGALEWERDNHRFKGLSWEGHCNGWAASSILRPEPRRSMRDSTSRVTFSVSDLKGLLTEKDDCVKYAFFGKRNRGLPTNDPRDIAPNLFHDTITYYIGRLGKPVVMDHMAGRPVDNQVISGYQASVTRTDASNLTVNMTLTIHHYDSRRTDSPGTAPSFKKTYKYILHEDSGGNIVSGTWLSENPDFLWVPLSISHAGCAPTNPRVSESWLESIFSY
jgi:hypothetical protein